MRRDGRSFSDLRPVEILAGWQRRAEGSVLYRCGGTRVLCTASVDDGVRDFLRGKGRGWVTAEYVMHPRAGARRQTRDGFNGRSLSGRSHEIARLVGRSLRAVVDAKALGERTVTLDCDVLEADGGTRTASVTGAMVALALALHGMRQRRQISGRPLVAMVAAVSAGIVGDDELLDLTYEEDSAARMDLNVVATVGEPQCVVELQATAEGAPVPRERVDALVTLAIGGVRALAREQSKALASAGVDLDALIAAPRASLPGV